MHISIWQDPLIIPQKRLKQLRSRESKLIPKWTVALHRHTSEKDIPLAFQSMKTMHNYHGNINQTNNDVSSHSN